MTWVVDTFLDLAIYIAGFISDAVYILVNTITYPFIFFFTQINNIFKLIYSAFTGLFNTIWDTFNILYEFTTNLFTSIFPSLWTTLILLGLTIVFCLRLYYFIKDISILGNKI